MIWPLGTETKRYALYGALFGLCFPLIGTAILLYTTSLPFALSSIVTVQQQNALLWIINSAPLFLGIFAALAGVRQDRLIRVLAAREEVIKERTQDLEMANQAVKELLDNVHQAIFTVSAQGIVNPGYSAFTADLFGAVEIAGTKVTDLLQLESMESSEVAAQMQNWFKLVVGSDELQWLMTRDAPMATARYRRPGDEGQDDRRVLEFEYEPIYRDGVVGKVMVIAKDATALRDLERDVLRKDEQLALLSQLVSADRGEVDEFLSESRDLLRQASPPKGRQAGRARGDGLGAIKRAVHTIKGNARACGLPSVEDAAHQVENALTSLSAPEAPLAGRGAKSVEATLTPLDDALTRVAQMARDMGAGVPSRVSSGAPGAGSPALFRRLEAASDQLLDRLAAAGLDADDHRDAAVAELRQAVSSLCLVRLDGLWPHLCNMASELTKVTSKPVRLEFPDEPIAVSYTIRAAVRDVLVHALRNAIDHGIETPAQRRTAGKPAEATIGVTCRADADRLTVTVADDGAGIDVAALKRCCAERGIAEAAELATLSDEQASDLAFQLGASTTDAVTAISGRGVGMDIIRSIAAQHDGSARFVSTPGRGTELIVELARTSHRAEAHLARRRHERRRVYYYLSVTNEAGDEFGRLLDASVSGAMVAHEPSVSVGQQLEVTIHPPSHHEQGDPITCRITCRWTKQAPSGQGYIGGFVFDELRQRDLAELDRIITLFGMSGMSMLHANSTD